MRVHESRRDPFVGAVNNLCSGRSRDIVCDFCNDSVLDEDVSFERASLIVLRVSRDEAAFQEIRCHSELQSGESGWPRGCFSSVRSVAPLYALSPI